MDSATLSIGINLKAAEGLVPIRKNLSVHHDPYLPWGGLREMAACKRCGAVYCHKRWSMEGPPAALKTQPIRAILCPACRKVQEHFPGGIITLRGEFLKMHKEQILHLIHNEEARACGVNPLERIISIKDHGGTVEIQATSDRFTQRIGREIERACKGHTTYQWSKDNKFIRVEWRR